MIARAACLALGLTLAGSTVMAQTDSAVHSLLERARAGSERYRDPAVARADGYRPIGPEAPAMGQHWIHSGLLVAGHFDPDRPPILEYITVGGRPELVGVAYALPLAPGESPPDAPAGRTAWHSHARGIADESLRLTHEDDPAGPPRDRVAVLHVWAWVPNPAGPFAPLNWALPYLRAGVQVPELPGLDARALSLREGGAAFWNVALSRALDADAHTAAIIDQAVAAYADTVAAWYDHRTIGPRIDGSERDWLSALWNRLRTTLRAALGATRGDRLWMLTG